MKKKNVLGLALLISLNSLKSFASLTQTSSNTPSSQEQPSVDKHGTTPLHMTSDNDHRKTVEMLIKAGMQQDTIKKTTQKRKNRTNDPQDFVYSLPLSGFFDSCGWTPLHRAAWHEEQATVEQLLTARAAIDIIDKNHETYPYAWGQKGPRIYAMKNTKRTQRLSIISVLDQGQIKAPFVFEGTCDRDVFEAYLEAILLPILTSASST